MIDWLTIWLPRVAEWDLPGRIKVLRDQETGLETTLGHQGRQVPSFDTSVRVRPVDACIEVSGNPSKWLQGHNLFGSDDVPGTIRRWLKRIEQHPAIGQRLFPLHPLVYADIHEIHLAQMVDMDSPKNKTDFLNQLGLLSKTRHKSQFFYSGETVYFGKGGDKTSKTSRLYFWRFYDKLAEMKRHKQKQVCENWNIENHVRAEVVLKSMYLKQLGLNRPKSWTSETVSNLYLEMLTKINLAEGNIMDTFAPPPGMNEKDKRIWYQWVAGERLVSSMTRPTFYRVRRHMLDEHGIDISLPPYRSGNNLLSFGWAKLCSQNDWMQNNLNKYRKVA